MIGGSFRSSVGVGRFGTKERWGQRGLRNLTLRLINERRHRSTSLPFIGWPRRSSSSLSLSWTYLPPPPSSPLSPSLPSTGWILLTFTRAGVLRADTNDHTVYGPLSSRQCIGLERDTATNPAFLPRTIFHVAAR